jgi:PPK2 family polyphosphate:nucleotide phosphotransferase
MMAPFRRSPFMASPLKLPKRYRVSDDGKFRLEAFDPAADVLKIGDADAAKDLLKGIQGDIAETQNRLFAEGRQSLLLVLQGMDTSGKDGTTIAVFDRTHPQGVVVTPFKAPSAEEGAHDFLWRVHAHAPAKGMIAVFNRSHYEAVIAERVLGLADAAECVRRYAQIIAFERLLVEHDTTVVKCFLHISKDEQKHRLQSRLDDPTKYWKFNPNDLVERKRWDANAAAYEDAIRSTATKRAPWWIVPADAKPLRNLMVAAIVRDALEKMDPRYPPLAADARGVEVV